MDLEDHEKARETVRRVLPYEAGWLIQAIREKCAKDRDTMNETIQRDLDVSPSGIEWTLSDTILH